jgi:hypothetical protein
MRNNFQLLSIKNAMAAVMIAATSFAFASEGCTYHQTYGANKTSVSQGSVGQAFTVCQDGDLAYLSLFMQSSGENPFGARLSLFEKSGDAKTLVHTQQVVVPSAAQNPYAQIWLNKKLEVKSDLKYSVEIAVPDGREIIFYHSAENAYDSGDLTVNGEDRPVDLAFEYGVKGKPALSVAELSVKNNVHVWAPSIDADVECLAGQRFYQENEEIIGTVTHTFEACASERLIQVLVNGTLYAFGDVDPSATLKVKNMSGNVMATSTLTWDAASMTYMTFDFNPVMLTENETYLIELVSAVGVGFDFSLLTHPEFVNGDMTINGEGTISNMCFYAVLQNNPLDDTEETDEETGDESSWEDPWAGWDPYDHDLIVKPPKDVELLRHSVFPNPFSADFRLELDTEADVPATITLYNFMGTKVYETTIDNVSDSKFIDVIPESTLTNGYYTLRIEYGDNIILDTVVKH